MKLSAFVLKVAGRTGGPQGFGRLGFRPCRDVIDSPDRELHARVGLASRSDKRRTLPCWIEIISFMDTTREANASNDTAATPDERKK
jgi:hypothetical protein